MLHGTGLLMYAIPVVRLSCTFPAVNDILAPKQGEERRE